MIDAMKKALPDFGGQNSRARCFDHIVHLCAKSVLKPFDVQKDKAGEVQTAAEEAISAWLADLYASGLDAAAGEDIGEDDEDDGLVDERDGMEEQERADLDKSIVPVKLVLTKVRQLYGITYLLIPRLLPLPRFALSPTRLSTPPRFFSQPGTRSSCAAASLGRKTCN